jgi:hypothetical protein
MELWDHISDNLGLTQDKDRKCVKDILLNTFLLNEHQLTERTIDMLTKMCGAYVSEVKKLVDNPAAYKQKLEECRQQLIDKTADAVR